MSAHDSSPSERAVKHELHALVRQAVKKLPRRDCVFIERRYGFHGPEETLAQIGQSFGITKERVRQRLAVVRQRLEFQLAPFVNGPSAGEEPDVHGS